MEVTSARLPEAINATFMSPICISQIMLVLHVQTFAELDCITLYFKLKSLCTT